MQFSISQIARAADLQPGLLGAETAAFLLLSMTEDPALGTRHPDPTRLILEAAGAVSAAGLPPAEPLQVDRELRSLLRRLLAVSVGVNPRLVAVAEGEGDSLTAFRADLSTALIPINRPAAQRALIRLHRRVGEALGATPDNDAPVVQPLQPASAPLVVAALPTRRLTRRRPPPPPAFARLPASDEVPMAAHQSLPPAPVVFAGMPEIPESVTPFLGSLELEERDPSEFLASEVAFEPEALTDASSRVAWQTDGASTTVEFKTAAPALSEAVEAADSSHDVFPDAADGESEADVNGLTMRVWSLPPTEERSPENDAELDCAPSPLPIEPLAGPRAAPMPLPLPEASILSPYLGNFRPAVSDVRDLLRAFAPEKHTPPASERLLRHFAEAELADQSRTPPPVYSEARLPAPSEGARPSLAAWVASAALVGGAVLFRFAPNADPSQVSSVTAAIQPQPATQVSAPPATCTGQVRVETERHAQVQLIAGATRVSRPGPHAVFDAVACDGDLRVVVRLPDATANGDDAEWLQVPVPEARVRLAAETGTPVVLRMFPRPR